MKSTRCAVLGALLVAAVLANGCGARSGLSVDESEVGSGDGGGPSGGGATGSGSSGGGNACATMVCDTPPAPTCVSPTTLRTWSSSGTCPAGECSYASFDAVCPSGCSEGMCSAGVNRVRLSVGDGHACAVTSNGAAKCWGNNFHGHLGNNSTDNSPIPVDVVGLSSGVLAIATTSDHTCAVTSAGGVKCWGENAGGQLGNSTTDDSHVPVDVVGLSFGVVAVATGTAHTCAVLSTGAVKCWGVNDYGELGNDSTKGSLVPVDVTALSADVVAISAGEGAHTCAITSVGALKCWGANGNGQLGNDSTEDSHVPVDVVGLTSGVVSVSAGAAQTCAVLSSGAVKCWGSNFYGQLGNPTTLNSQVPVDVAGLSSGGLAVSTGYIHACAALSTGAVRCWGYNTYGELGNNTTGNSATPVDVVGLSGEVLGVSAGHGDTCAVTSTGAIVCWGYGADGELGNNSTMNSPVPVGVLGF